MMWQSVYWALQGLIATLLLKPKLDKARKRFRQSTSDKKPEKRISKERIDSPARKPETGKDDFF